MAERYRGRMATSHVNRNNMRVAPEALRVMATQFNEDGGFPILIAHDSTRPVGWVTRVWVEELEDGEHALESEGWIAVTREEIVDLKRRHDEYLLKLQNEEIEAYGGGPRLGGVLYSDHSCMTEYRPGIVGETYPKLAEHTNGDGLVVLGGQFLLRETTIRHGEHLLLPHRFLRRSSSMRNTLDADFLARLDAMSERDDVELTALRIDDDHLGIEGTQKQYMEADYWWGPEYSGQLGSTPPGMATHGADDKTRLLMGLDRTEFFSYDRDGLRSMEIEEVHERPVVVDWLGERYSAERYMHMNVDPESSRVKHLDGAIRLYGIEAWRERRQSKLSDVRKGQGYVKLFRVDGDLPQEVALELAHFYYRNNPMVAERFGLTESAV